MKKNTRWNFLLLSCLFLLMSFQEFQEQQPPDGPSPELKKLDWLVGQWVDKNDTDDMEINLNYTWDEQRHFLTNEFSIVKTNNKFFEGKQIITWDPAKKTYRSWMFDSDGGFGQGKWKHQDGKWIVEIDQTLPDGGSASAINIYKKIDENSYSFESVNRMVDGQLLPNVGPVTIIRKKSGDKS